MRTRIGLLLLTICAVLGLALFVPSITYAGQVTPNQLMLSSTSTDLASGTVILTDRGHRGHGGAAFRGGGWSVGVPGTYYYGSRYYTEPYVREYYVEPGCDRVWDSYLNRWVCADRIIY